MVIDDPIAVCAVFAAYFAGLAVIGAALYHFFSKTMPGIWLKDRLGFGDEPEWSDKCSR